MIMEYIAGDSLYNVVRGAKGGPLRVPDTARFFIKVLDGLNAAHEGGLIHRDIKPSNIMVTPDGDAKILDLGLARAMGEESPLTRPNVVIGTLDYASPEQLGNAAEAARAFRLPIAELEDEDLRLLDDEDSSGPIVSLRDLGNAEPTVAPMHKRPRPAVPALVLLPGEDGESSGLPPRRGGTEDTRWLIHFVAIAIVLGLLAVLVITLFRMS